MASHLPPLPGEAPEQMGHTLSLAQPDCVWRQWVKLCFALNNYGA